MRKLVELTLDDIVRVVPDQTSGWSIVTSNGKFSASREQVTQLFSTLAVTLSDPTT